MSGFISVPSVISVLNLPFTGQADAAGVPRWRSGSLALLRGFVSLCLRALPLVFISALSAFSVVNLPFAFLSFRTG